MKASPVVTCAVVEGDVVGVLSAEVMQEILRRFSARHEPDVTLVP